MKDNDITIMTVAYLITAFLLALFVNYNTKLGIEQDLNRGELRLFDKKYSCELIGRYVSDERFVPNEVSEENVKELLKEYEKYKQEIEMRK